VVSPVAAIQSNHFLSGFFTKICIPLFSCMLPAPLPEYEAELQTAYSSNTQSVKFQVHIFMVLC